MLKPDAYVTKPQDKRATLRKSAPGLCSRCAMAPAQAATWPGGCPLNPAIRDLCPHYEPEQPAQAQQPQQAQQEPTP